MSVTIVCLGLDLDWLINGPAFMAKVCSRIKEKLVNEGPVDDEELRENLNVASESVWLQMFVIIVVAITIIFIIINIIGCAGSCMLSYSLLSGFTIFMLLSSILAITAASAFFLPLANLDVKMDSPLKPLAKDLIISYKSSEVGSAKLILDTVQRELQCCGYDSLEDWLEEEEINAGIIPRGSGISRNSSSSSRLLRSLPATCCPVEVEDCTPEDAFSLPCRESIGKNYLSPNNAIGLTGIFILAVVTFMCLTFIISFLMCCIARKTRGIKWAVVNWGTNKGETTFSQDSVIVR